MLFLLTFLGSRFDLLATTLHLHHHRCSYHRYSCTITTDAYMCDDEEEEEEEDDDDDDDVGGNDHHDGVIANCDGDGDNLAMSMMS